jgi:hypothetical protein
MTTYIARTKQVGNHILFMSVILPSIEIPRIVAMTISIVPLCLFCGAEYIASGKTKYTEKWAYTLENYGKQTVEEMAVNLNIEGKIY